MIWRKPRHFACIIHSNSSPHPPSCASQPQPKRTSVNRDHFVSLFSCSSVPTPVTGNGLGPWLSLLPFLRIHRSPTRSRLAPIIIALTFNARYLPNLISFLFQIFFPSFEFHLKLYLQHPNLSFFLQRFDVHLSLAFFQGSLLRDFSRFLQLSDTFRYRITKHSLPFSNFLQLLCCILSDRG